MSDVLSTFSEPVRRWFQTTLGEPTPPQVQGWPAIQRGDNTVILAPTGSGKTLAAFLWGIDQLLRDLPSSPQNQGVRIVYVSPLKALNNDIQRNLRFPLQGIRAQARQLDTELPHISVMVRSGDTPQRERRAMVGKPPHILITTPESFYLMLTSPRARGIFHTVRTVIVDEIHTLAGNKRGVHLSLSLERLDHLTDTSIQRIGLSATIRPLEEVARFLGGSHWLGAANGARSLEPRPVTLIDTGYRKPLDLLVETVVDDFRNLPGDSVWPALVPRVLDLIDQHQTTLIFANNRRQAERTADRLNEQIAAKALGQDTGLIADGVVRGIGMMAAGTGRGGPIRAHHGSMAKEARLEMEHQLKEGQLPALVGTSSLELGIDIGSVDLVVQLQSPRSVSQGLQRVGRAGHLVGQTSKGRIFPTHREDVMEAAAIAGGMLRGEVEPIATPRNPLDVLAQQVVAMVSLETWNAEALFDTIRCAYAYHDLTGRVYHSVLDMLSGRLPSQAHRELRPRISWDRVNDTLAALPGSRMTALTNGGTIADRGSFNAVISSGNIKLGELDEEFVYETRPGDTFMLGSQVWRVLDITDDKVKVVEAPGAVPRMPFWRGDFPWRPFELGRKVGQFRRLVAERLRELEESLKLDNLGEIRHRRDEPAIQALLAWLHQDFAVDANSAWHVLTYVAGQLDSVGAISSDRTVIVETFDDALGDPRMVVHSPFGGRVNGPWGLALAGALREQAGVEVEVQANDDGILLRFPLPPDAHEGANSVAEFPRDLVAAMSPTEARERILNELPDSAVFGARFRQNAARALLLPNLRGGKRTPFWLQRLRAKDLLQVARKLPDFPIVAETYRDVLQDVLDLPHLEAVLSDIQAGQIEVVAVESIAPSPVAQSLLWDFISVYMYEWDAPKAEKQLQSLAMQRDLLQDLLKDVALDELLRPEAVEDIRRSLQHTAATAQARTSEELAVLLQELGDLSPGEIAQRSTVDPSSWIAKLAGQRRIIMLSIPTISGADDRWIAAEYEAQYRSAFGLSGSRPPPLPLSPLLEKSARRMILERYLRHSGPVTIEAIKARYAFPDDWLKDELTRLIAARDLAQGRFTPKSGETTASAVDEFIDRQTLERIHRRTLSILRREVEPVPFTAYAEFLSRWQHIHPAHRLTGSGALTQVLQQLRAVPVVGLVWERDVLPLRLESYDPSALADLCQRGELVWIGSGGHATLRRGRVRFLFRGEGETYLEPPPEVIDSEPGGEAALSPAAVSVYEFLRSEGALFMADICAGLSILEDAASTALVELVMAGLVTNDSLATMRRIVHTASTTGSAAQRSAQPYSSLEAQLAKRMGPRSRRIGPGQRPHRSELRAARRRVEERLAQGPQWDGRWALVHRFGIMGKALPPEERAARRARQLLSRYGVVTRESLAAEEGGWAWQPIYGELQRMEMRGDVRRGYFVQDLPGPQFALPEVVEQLRSLRSEPDDQLVLMNACDPANLYGPARVDGLLTDSGLPLVFPRIPSTWVILQRGLPVLLAEDTGARLSTAQGAREATIRRSLQTLLDHLGSFRWRISTGTWNGDPVLDSDGQPLLESVGFYRDYPNMTWERPSFSS